RRTLRPGLPGPAAQRRRSEAAIPRAQTRTHRTDEPAARGARSGREPRGNEHLRRGEGTVLPHDAPTTGARQLRLSEAAGIRLPYSLCQGPALVWDHELSTPPARDRPPSRRHPRGGALRGRLRVLALRRPADGDPGDLRPA